MGKNGRIPPGRPAVPWMASDQPLSPSAVDEPWRGYPVEHLLPASILRDVKRLERQLQDAPATAGRIVLVRVPVEIAAKAIDRLVAEMQIHLSSHPFFATVCGYKLDFTPRPLPEIVIETTERRPGMDPRAPAEVVKIYITMSGAELGDHGWG